MGNCSVCNAVMSPEQGKIYTAGQLRSLVSRGFEPPVHALDAMWASYGMTREQKLARWKTEVVANNTNNWLFCPSCNSQASRFIPVASTMPGGLQSPQRSTAVYSRPSGRAWGKIMLFSVLGLVVIGALAVTLGFALGWFGGNGPEKTVKNYLEALEKKDANKLMGIVSPSSGQQLEKMTGGYYDSLEELLDGVLSGYESVEFKGVKYKTSIEGDTAIVEVIGGTATIVDASGNETTEDLRIAGDLGLVKEDSKWYIDFTKPVTGGSYSILEAVQKEVDPTVIPVNELLTRLAESGKAITSLHQQVDLSYDPSPYGFGVIQSRTIEISGSDVYVQEMAFGKIIAEKVLVNGRQFTKSYTSGRWTEEEPTLNVSNSMASGVGSYESLASNSQKQQNLGVEMEGSYECIHLRFELSPENVRNMVTQVSPESLAENTGGTVDIWMCRDKPNYLIKSVGFFQNITIPSQGLVNITIVITRSSINQPITVSSPI